MNSVRFLLAKSVDFFAAKGLDNCRLEAELLLAYVLQSDRIHLYMDLDKPLSQAEVDQYRTLVTARASGKPAAYLTGKREFYSLDFCVSEAVLIPRPETEHIIDIAKKVTPNARRVLDIGTGSGILAVTLARELVPEYVLAVDISADALRIAQKNGAKLLSDPSIVQFKKSDIYESVTGRFDLIVSNPPYITTAEYASLDAGVKEFEPQRALEAGSDGLRYYSIIIGKAPQFLQEEGCLLLEISDTVAAGVVSLAEAAGFQEIDLFDDYAGHKRVALLRR